MSKWKQIYLNECVELNMGQSPSSSTYNTLGNGIPFFQGNADFGEITPNVKYFCSEPIKIANKGDLLISVRAPIGALNFASEKCCIGRGLCSLSAKNCCNIKYLFYILQYKKSELNAKGTGSTFKAINKQSLSETKIPLPPLEEQHKIASILDTVSEALKLRKQQLNELDLLVKSKFVEMFGGCTKEVMIGDVISICRGASPRPISTFITDNPDGVNWIKIGDVTENSLYITHTEEKITKEGAKKSRTVHKGNFILSNSMSFGRPYILGIDGCVHDGWLILSNFSDTFDELYLYHALRSENIQHQFSSKVNGATVKNLNSDLVKTTYIKLPDMQEQMAFSNFVQTTDELKSEVQKSINQLQILFNSLMQQYFE